MTKAIPLAVGGVTFRGLRPIILLLVNYLGIISFVISKMKREYNKEKQMQANLKWREKNPEHWAELARIEARKYYEKNRLTKSAKVLNNYYLKKELKTFLNILLE